VNKPPPVVGDVWERKDGQTVQVAQVRGTALPLPSGWATVFRVEERITGSWRRVRPFRHYPTALESASTFHRRIAVRRGHGHVQAPWPPVSAPPEPAPAYSTRTPYRCPTCNAPGGVHFELCPVPEASE
jgi:hypothetical protein